jgi:hypothetical protein
MGCDRAFSVTALLMRIRILALLLPFLECGSCGISVRRMLRGKTRHYTVDLSNVILLDLIINPDKQNTNALASLLSLRLA